MKRNYNKNQKGQKDNFAFLNFTPVNIDQIDPQTNKPLSYDELDEISDWIDLYNSYY